ncbi:MAG: YybH family protein [Streptosporangiaceae bacterium]
MNGFDDLSDRYHRALEASIQGDPEPVLALWSKRDDATLANPFGPPVRGWEAVRDAGMRAASQVADGEAFSVESISAFATTELAYEVEIHRFRARVGGAGESAPLSLRVTTILGRRSRHPDRPALRTYQAVAVGPMATRNAAAMRAAVNTWADHAA